MPTDVPPKPPPPDLYELFYVIDGSIGAFFGAALYLVVTHTTLELSPGEHDMMRIFCLLIFAMGSFIASYVPDNPDEAFFDN